MHIDLGRNPGRVVTQPDSFHIGLSSVGRRSPASTGPESPSELLRVMALNAHLGPTPLIHVSSAIGRRTR